jgi:ATP-dependent protease ClpP protease subunit
VKAREWFRVENSAADPSVAEIHIIDFIGSWDDDWFGRNFGYEMGVTARAFVEALAALPPAVSTIKLHINSPGGDVQAGINIANALREQTAKGRTVETVIDGIAASIASVIAMAGSKVRISDNGLMMIHNPMSVGIGTAADMRKTADILDTMRGQIINTYKWHSSMEPEAIAGLMDAETWMDADAAIANGFATEKVTGLKAVASIHASASNLKVPEKFKARVDALLQKPTPAPAQPVAASAAEILRACKAADCLELAEDLVETVATAEQVQTRVAAAKAAKTAAAARVTQITKICTDNKQSELAQGYIDGAMTVDQVKAHLLIVTAKIDRLEIDGGLNPENRANARPGVKAKADLDDAYGKLNAATTKKE